MPLDNVQDFYPLTPLQEGLLFHSLSEPDSRMYFNQTEMRLGGGLDAARFRRAWQAVVDHHPILRTFFVWEGVKAPVQVVQQHSELPWEEEDWRSLTSAEITRRLAERREQDLAQGFPLNQAPLMRARLFHVGEGEAEFLWSFHHILMDGWSMFQVLGDVFQAYDQLAGGGTVSLRPRPAFRQHLAWLGQQDRARARAFWKRTLGGFSTPTPLVDSRSLGELDEAPDRFATLPLFLEAETAHALEALAQRERVTLNTILQATWALLLGRTAGTDDAVFGSVVSGRPADLPGVEDMVGLFINTLPVRVPLPEDPPVGEWLRSLQAQQVEQREYEYSRLVDVQGCSEVPRGENLFDTILMFENYRKDGELEDLSRSLTVGDVRWYERQNFPIAALAIPGDRFQLRLIYMTDRFGEATIRRMLGHWRHLLEQVVAAPQAPVGDLQLATAAEREELLCMGTGVRTEIPRDRSIAALFQETAAASPERVALRFRDHQHTYRELNARANQVAHALRARGVDRETPVAVCIDRSDAMVVAILGILKAGGAYVPLDPTYPRERLSLMVEECAAPVLLVERRHQETIPAGPGALVVWEDLEQELPALPEEDPASTYRPGDLAYVMFTSGSTGRPKGTCVPQQAVIRLVRHTDFATFDGDTVALQFAPISFDASTLEVWGPLLNGGRLVVYPEARASLEDLGALIQGESINTLWLTAGLFHQMVDGNLEGLRGVRQLLAGGDVLSVPHVRRALAELEGCTLINGYGPTENTTFTCCHRMTRDNPPERTVPIGRPIANTTVYLLDQRGHLVPVGVAGELFTGGDGVARGYLGRAELTGERFLADPFADREGARMYRTGDQARYLPDGTLEFLGRRDQQVKIRGYRIELGEIEVALMRHGQVRDAVVVAREDQPGDKRLVAYLVPEGDAPGFDELRRFLGEHLPAYMVPAASVTLDAFPLNANGKVDRAALPAPEMERPDLASAFVAPAAGMDQTIAGIWQEVLGLERVGVADNFFDLGGHSLSLVRVHARLQEELGRSIPMVDLFQYPTIQALSAHLGEAGEAGPAAGEAPGAARRQEGRQRLKALQDRRRRRT